jgi:hypothetical protein
VIDDGGQAFPSSNAFGDRDPGMTLRDWFAGQALTRLAKTEQGKIGANNIAIDCYAFADSMLKARTFK